MTGAPSAIGGMVWPAWVRRNIPDLLLALEAFILVGMSSAAIRTLRFGSIGRIASCPVRRAAPSDVPRLIGRVRWAIDAAARRSPWRAVCFQQGLAAQIMLRRRGVASTLYFGAAPDPEAGLAAHVWVRCGELDVVGCDVATTFPVLASFPEA